MQWKIDDTPVDYPAALAAMEQRVADIHDGIKDEQVWLLEHPPLYTAGTSAQATDLLDARFPVYEAGRGGQYTYHGPGQRIGYVMLNLKNRRPDLRCYVHDLEEWLIATLDEFNIKGERREGRVGIWVDMSRYGKPPGTEAKIAAIGVRVRKWVTFHGVSLNIDPDLSHFSGIVPCGISQHGVTSFFDLGHAVSMAEMDAAMQHTWDRVFGDAA